MLIEFKRAFGKGLAAEATFESLLITATMDKLVWMRSAHDGPRVGTFRLLVRVPP
jgi:hypothetical protein